MIFVTVGTHYQGFERLVKKMDEIACGLGEEVIMQIGNTKYTPSYAEWFPFLEDEEEFMKIMKTAEVVVAHGGAGTLLSVLSFGKPVVVVPRLRRYGEHTDDQQIELAEALKASKGIAVVYDVEYLAENLKNARVVRGQLSGRGNVLKNFLRDYLGRLSS